MNRHKRVVHGEYRFHLKIPGTHHIDFHAQFRSPCNRLIKRNQAGQPRHRRLHGDGRLEENHVVFCQRKVVTETQKIHLERSLFYQVPGRRNLVKINGALTGQCPFGRKRRANAKVVIHPGARVHLAVGAERIELAQFAVVIVLADGIQRRRVQLPGAATFP